MKRIISYLNQENSLKIGNKTVGSILSEREISSLYSERESDIDTIVIHFMSNCVAKPTSPFETEDLINIFIQYGVSAHFLIQRDGTIFELVPPSKKAWHAGASIMPIPDNREGVNDFSIGIELVGGDFIDFTSVQYESLGVLCNDLHQEFQIKSILGHEDIAGVRAVKKGFRTDCKTDPGPYFDWEKFGSLLPSALAQFIKHGN